MVNGLKVQSSFTESGHIMFEWKVFKEGKMGEVSQVLWISGKMFLIDSGKWAANYGIKSSNKLKRSRNHEKFNSKYTGIKKSL